MGSTDDFPIKAPTRQMLYPLSYRGTFQKLWHVSTSKSDVNRANNVQKLNKKEIAPTGDLFVKVTRKSLRRAGMFLGFSEHATAIEGIVDNLAHCRSFRINVHSVARFQVSDDTFCSDLESDAVEFRITTCLNMVDSHQPLV